MIFVTVRNKSHKIKAFFVISDSDGGQFPNFVTFAQKHIYGVRELKNSLHIVLF